MVTDFGQESKGLLFSHKLRRRARQVGAWLCVGLDPEIDRLPAGLPSTAAGVVTFCREIITATEPFAAAFKINFAFFEALGPDGWQALAEVRGLISSEIPVVADAKRGDIGSTAAAYARSIFDNLDFDASTLSPYLGWDALDPFLPYPGRALFVLAHTSNRGAGEFQDRDSGGEPLYLRVARGALAREGNAEVGLVAGATFPDQLQRLRGLNPNVVLLVPGVGAQGAEPEITFRLASNGAGENALIAVSRAIIFASSEAGYAAAAARAAEDLSARLRR
jgi:orotidine-5'-phosphate decarboxylase